MANGLITASEFSEIEGECSRWGSEDSGIFVGNGVHKGQSLTHTSMETLYQSVYNRIDSVGFKKYVPNFVFQQHHGDIKPSWTDRDYLIGEPRASEELGGYYSGIFTYIQSVCQNCPSDGVCSHGGSCDSHSCTDACQDGCANCYGSEFVCSQHACGSHTCGIVICPCDVAHYCRGHFGCVSDCTGAYAECSNHHCGCYTADTPVCSDTGC